MIILLCILAWFILGILGFVYWYTNDYNFTTADLGLAIFAGIFLGPFSYIVGYAIHGKSNDSRVIIKKKRNL